MTAQRGGWGDGTLTQVSDGKWKLRYPPYLGRGQVTFPAANKTAAKKEQRRLLEMAYAKQHAPSSARFTFGQWCELELGRHVADPHSTLKLRHSLKSPVAELGDLLLADITYDHLANWRATASKRYAPTTVHGYTQAIKQMLNAAVRSGVLPESPGRHLKNPKPQAGTVLPFEKFEDVVAVAEQLPPQFRALPVFGCLTGLRVEEWLALERGDIRDGYVHVNKRMVRGVLKQGTKNGDPERRVFLDPTAQEWLDRQPKRIDTRLIWAGKSGRHLVLQDFRPDIWNPAVKAAGIAPARRLKDMRHTCATWQLVGNCNTWTLSKQLGTAVSNIETTYGRWIEGSERVLLSAMDSFLGRAAQ